MNWELPPSSDVILVVREVPLHINTMDVTRKNLQKLFEQSCVGDENLVGSFRPQWATAAKAPRHLTRSTESTASKTFQSSN